MDRIFRYRLRSDRPWTTAATIAASTAPLTSRPNMVSPPSVRSRVGGRVMSWFLDLGEQRGQRAVPGGQRVAGLVALQGVQGVPLHPQPGAVREVRIDR